MFYYIDLLPKMLDAHREEGRSKKIRNAKSRPQGGVPNREPAQRVAVGSEEQQNERAMSFVIK